MGLNRLGCSLDEMARLTMADFIALTDIAAGAAKAAAEGPAPRKATQQDIDRLLG